MFKKKVGSIITALFVAGAGIFAPSPVNHSAVVRAAEGITTHSITCNDDFQQAVQNATDNDVYVLRGEGDKDNGYEFNDSLNLSEDQATSVKNLHFIIDAYTETSEENRNDLFIAYDIVTPGRNFTLDLKEKLNKNATGSYVSIDKSITAKTITVKGNGSSDWVALWADKTPYNAETTTFENVSVMLTGNTFNGDVVFKNVNPEGIDSITVNGRLILDNTSLAGIPASKINASGGVVNIEDIDDNNNNEDAAVQNVISVINNMNPDDEEQVSAAREEYNKLSNEQKTLVTNYQTLVDAENTLTDKSKANEVIALIQKINAEDKDSVTSARTAYNNLTKKQKEYVTNYSDLTEAENQIATREENERKANLVTEMINNMDSSDKASVEAVRKEYDKLTEEQKNLVTNYNDLVEAETKLSEDNNSSENDNPSGNNQTGENGNQGTETQIPEKETNTNKITTVAVKKIAVKGETKTIAFGKRTKLTAEVYPKNATNKKVVWSSSNNKTATVKNGVVTAAKNAGGKVVTITVKSADGKAKATYRIKVAKGIVKKVKISGKKKVKAGKTLKLKATVKATKGAYKAIAWKSSNTKFATVKNGKVKATKAGKGKTVKITAYALDGSCKKASKNIKIK